MSEKILKTRKFLIESQDLDEIKNSILKLNGIDHVIAKNKTLIISYDLRLNNYQTLKQHLSCLTKANIETFFDKLQSSFISFYERNEFDHAHNPSGWDYYIQNVYLSLHKEH